ncbi:hypothetical protein H8356DRAFT_1434491 [Neocallimastix lanati (nom. inval.)]|nr:hypothetical protein H8356DRAFT_1434491 [Neocallimastix sp. JGI-2020a]
MLMALSSSDEKYTSFSIGNWYYLFVFIIMDRHCKIPNLSKSVDVVLIRHNDNTGSSSIATKDESLPSSSINDESGESLVDTTLSILKIPSKDVFDLSFIISWKFRLLGELILNLTKNFTKYRNNSKSKSNKAKALCLLEIGSSKFVIILLCYGIKSAQLATFTSLKIDGLHSNNNSVVVLIGDFNMPFEKFKKIISNYFPDWMVTELSGSKSLCIDHVIYNKDMTPHNYLYSSCSSFTGISDLSNYSNYRNMNNLVFVSLFMSPFFIQAEDSVSIFNILIKLFHIGIRDKCFKTYFTSKARARFINILSDEFFINQDDIVLITPTEIKINAFFRYIFNWANKNKMSFVEYIK